MFKFAIEVCFANLFELIRTIFLSLGSSKSVYFFRIPGIKQTIFVSFLLGSVVTILP